MMAARIRQLLVCKISYQNSDHEALTYESVAALNLEEWVSRRIKQLGFLVVVSYAFVTQTTCRSQLDFRNSSRWRIVRKMNLFLSVYTSHGPTLIAPTWFISRELFAKLGGFKDEIRTGFPEDLDFFYRALDLKDISFCKVDKELVIYRYHSGCASLGVSEDAIWTMRIDRFCHRMLPMWKTFTIWNAGKQGKRFFRSLSDKDRGRVVSFCDVDEKKIRRGWFEDYDEATRTVRRKLPIIHVKVARPPLVICVKLDMTGGDLERLVAESQWTEGRDYIHFS
ncbi:hypothetical protein NECAME_10843 [Necator americanus]|uniref:Nucleotide-diphospho-sugar transferase domain-containing protein n=1 Tax=Necator americanus TaxID=51031 RepID=W2T998_NECAM|nr:hypothetical protein NECAME_10843 [Necator americanus]ETN77751.1 hypothetical protein NECAME_10843 [Necator americanus]